MTGKVHVTQKEVGWQRGSGCHPESDRGGECLPEGDRGGECLPEGDRGRWLSPRMRWVGITQKVLHMALSCRKP